MAEREVDATEREQEHDARHAIDPDGLPEPDRVEDAAEDDYHDWLASLDDLVRRLGK
jgi:hypothetical protein